MKGELFYEEGIVTKVSGHFAEISIVAKENCKTCNAKLFCNPASAEGNSDIKSIRAYDPLGVTPGQEVVMALTGTLVVKSVFLLYGVPLILLIVGILTGLLLFENTQGKEAFAFLTGIVLMCAYYAGFYYSGKLSENSEIKNLPQIVKIKKSFEFSRSPLRGE
ncbi:MAG: SoxR reducing system RseC family protein [Ignavibacteriaceae bacterium]|nr:SoxR reducing system RseC family protein [Ignavibacteriaceae bacterium]